MGQLASIDGQIKAPFAGNLLLKQTPKTFLFNAGYLRLRLEKRLAKYYLKPISFLCNRSYKPLIARMGLMASK